MKTLPLLLAGLLLLGSQTACSAHPSRGYYEREVYYQPSPPPMRHEYRGYAPSNAHVWIGGYWNWLGFRYDWVPGYWSAPRHHHDSHREWRNDEHRHGHHGHDRHRGRW